MIIYKAVSLWITYQHYSARTDNPVEQADGNYRA